MLSPEDVGRPGDLRDWRYPGTALAVLGQPIAHSVSPAMHNAALAELAEADAAFASWRYFRFEVEPAHLGVLLPRFHRAGFQGLNLTVPHKVEAVPLVLEIDEFARSAGAVNTLMRRETGWAGTNTDGYGLRAAIREELGLDLAGATVVLLGAGGAARGAAAEILLAGARALLVGNRSAERLHELLSALRPLALQTALTGFPIDEPPLLPPGALVINATSRGLREGEGPPIDLARLPRPAAVYDMIYNPPETALLRQARAQGLPVANGLGMLVHQGARSLEHWTGRPAPVGVMRAAAEAALTARR